MSTEKRKGRFEKANINYSRDLRTRKDNEFSSSLEKKHKSQSRIQEILKAKRIF
jgi:hypothetical protein